MSSATPVTEPIVFRWHRAAITAIAPVTPHVTSVRLRCPLAESFRAGQHVDVRLTAEDGYQAQRSYSIASAQERMRRAARPARRKATGCARSDRPTWR